MLFRSRAEPEYLEIMPGPSAWPFAAALFTALFFLLLTVQAYSVAIACAVIAVGCVLRWLWDTDRPVVPEEVDAGAGIMLPTYVTGPRSHGWWAMIVLLIVIGMIFVMTLFSFVFLFGVHPQFWAPAPPIGWLLPILGPDAVAALLVLLARRLLCKGTTLWTPPTLMLIAAPMLLIALLVDIWSWRSSGFDPELTAQAALVHAFLVQQALLCAISLLMALYIAVRASRGMITEPRSNSFDLVTLFLFYTAAQGCAAALVTRAIPAAM